MSRVGFGILTEDPFYDDDGVLVDEDADWEDIQEIVEGGDISFDPHDTINS